MSTLIIILLLMAGCLLSVLSLALRARSGGKYEIRMIDLVLVLLPLLFWLVGAGKIQKIAFGGVEIETAQAFVNASKASIKSQVALTKPLSISDVVHTVEPASKGGVERIPQLIERKTEALEFQLGHGGYWGPAIKTYFDSLEAYAFLRYAIIYNPDGTLFGVYIARDLLRYFRRKGDSAYEGFARYLNSGDKAARNKLGGLPGFIPGSSALTTQTGKRKALEMMAAERRDVLPVVDAKRRIVGMVERSQLIASLIIEVSKSLEKRQ